MKKKLTAVALIVCMLAIMLVGASLAYFTDEAVADNTFTLGNVDISLREEFAQNAKLMPNEEDKIQKEVYVKNDGTEPAYVRIQYAIPSALVDADIDSYNDILHVNMTGASIADGQWSWLPEMPADGAKGWTDNGLANNNTYTTTIDGVEHTVWVVTYTEAVAAGKETATPAISSVYMDKHVEATGNEDGSVTYTKPNFTTGDRDKTKADGVMSYTVEKGEAGELTTTIKVVAEATQIDSFDDAYDALNTAFGVPGSYNPFAAE